MVTKNTFDIFSWNVRGIKGYKKRRKVFNWMVKHSSVNSIFMLQETHSTPNDEKNWRKQRRGKLFFSHRASNGTGILVEFREGLNYFVNKEVKDNNGGILMLDVEIQGKPYLIINLYADNDQAGQLVTLSKLESLLQSFDIKEECKIILGGDFNIIFDKRLDADGGWGMGDLLVSK